MNSESFLGQLIDYILYVEDGQNSLFGGCPDIKKKAWNNFIVFTSMNKI